MTKEILRRSNGQAICLRQPHMKPEENLSLEEEGLDPKQT